MLARSLLQPAQITSFGLKCAQSAAAATQHRPALAAGAPGLVRAAGRRRGQWRDPGLHRLAVEQALAQHLGLEACGHSWHTQRDDWMRLAMEVAVCCGSLSKLARDWSLMSQYEVAEISEAARQHFQRHAAQAQSRALHAGRGPDPGRAAAGRPAAGCMAQAHERALGEWQAEVAHWPDLWRHAHGAAAALRQAAQTLQVHPQRMLAHVAGLRGLCFGGLRACPGALHRQT
jgi:3-carboxy-cis,cis-muconate cycloisomerase